MGGGDSLPGGLESLQPGGTAAHSSSGAQTKIVYCVVGKVNLGGKRRMNACKQQQASETHVKFFQLQTNYWKNIKQAFKIRFISNRCQNEQHPAPHLSQRKPLNAATAAVYFKVEEFVAGNNDPTATTSTHDKNTRASGTAWFTFSPIFPKIYVIYP